MEYDIFVSHASEDKQEVALPLTVHLREQGLKVWLDHFELTLGDSLRRKIDEGLSRSRFGLVILSADFFRKEWPNKELDGLVARENGREKVILPIWHKVTETDIVKYSPSLADKIGISTSEGLPEVARNILQAVQRANDESSAPTRPTTGPRSTKPEAKQHDLTGIELVLIPEGTFIMGSLPGQGEKTEWPHRKVTISAFELARYPVTRGQYNTFLLQNPEVKPPPFWDDPRYNGNNQPVVGVTWNDAQTYAKWAGLRLPTEAEWEYACRAGSDTVYWSGNTLDDLSQVGWYGGNAGNGGDRLHDVCGLQENDFGLFDLHGNVWEWCADFYQPSYNRNDLKDPKGPTKGHDRVLRGGTWYDPGYLARSAHRLFHHPASVISSVGFRLARDARTGT